ncbi:MAG: tetratricopeptide repeat protein [Methanolinea sp.]|nr:tetratricopeptide repeat protein [Methanolinea sp.]
MTEREATCREGGWNETTVGQGPGNQAPKSCALPLTSEAIRLSRRGRHAEALDLLSQALQEDPTSVQAWVASGFALGKLGRFREEVKACDQALALDPTNVEAWINRGFAMGKLGRFSEKLLCCERAIQLDPSNAQAWNAKGHTLGELGRFEEELTCTEIATSLRPRYVGAWVNRGYTLLKLKRHREALSALSWALSISPGFSSAWVLKGITLCEMGRFPEALSCFVCAEESRPLSGPRNLYWKALALSRSGQRKEAVRLLEEVVRGNPRHVDAWIELSNCYFLTGEIDESVRCFMVAYDLDRETIRDCLSRAVALLKEGRREEGLRSLSEALGILVR